MDIIGPIVAEHHKKMIFGEPVLNYCDDSVMVGNIILLEKELTLRFLLHPELVPTWL